MGFLSSLWKDWGKSKSILPEKKEAKKVVKKTAKKVKKTAKKK